MVQYRLAASARAASVGCLVWLSGCSKPQSPAEPAASATIATPSVNRTRARPEATVATRAATDAFLPGASAAQDAAQQPASSPGCRALSVQGKATVNGSAITAGMLLDGQRWIELEPGAVLDLHHTLTSREFQLLGPGRMLPCRRGAEQLLVASGRLSTSANLGVRPGAEVSIVSALGLVRYGDAALDLEYGPQGLRVRVKEGEAWLEPATPHPPAIKNPLRRGAQARLLGPPLAVRALVARCQAAATAARDSARRVLDKDAAAQKIPLGERAETQMRDRKQARAACATAAAALGTSADTREIQTLSVVIRDADDLWQSVPRP